MAQTVVAAADQPLANEANPPLIVTVGPENQEPLMVSAQHSEFNITAGVEVEPSSKIETTSVRRGYAVLAFW
jgi:hypothetical protein